MRLLELCSWQSGANSAYATPPQALFRPITVVVPDRQLIMENSLMAEGFVTAKVQLLLLLTPATSEPPAAGSGMQVFFALPQALAKKFATLYSLLEDLLSPAKHYDFGLRAIK